MPLNRFARLDRKYIWHPFTQMKDWVKSEPIVISSGKGALLRDVHGNEYIDANSSIWTNLHGHGHPAINAAIQRQLKKIAHSSALGFANEPASILAEKLIRAVNAGKKKSQPRLTKVFYSDDGSTAMEVALKVSYEFARRSGLSAKPRFLSLENAYHGDTVGAVSLGHLDLFHKAYSGLLFKSDPVMSPYCYRCPFNRAKPERADARDYRKCQWECVDQVEEKFVRQKARGKPYTAMAVEPIIQGVAGMIAHPRGWLRRVAEITRAHDAHLIVDEVMTGFGRTGSLFACHREGIQPDLMAVAKGMTGGYVPMAATFVAQPFFDVFLGDYTEFKTFFHGHSFTANQIGSAAALASLETLHSKKSQASRRRVQQTLRKELNKLWSLSHVGDVRQEGCVAGVELVEDWRTRKPFALERKMGIKVCRAMAKKGVLTRPIGNVIVLMPPYCATHAQIKKIVASLATSIKEVCGA